MTATTNMKAEKPVEVQNVGEEQNDVSKSKAEAKEGVQKKRGRKVNTDIATKSQEKKNKPRGCPKQGVTTKEEMVTTMGVDDDNKSPEEGMVDVQIVVATPDRGTNEAINNKQNGGNICHHCVHCMKKWRPDMTEEMFAACCSVCQGNCNCTHCLRNVCPKSCIKVALDSLSPENVGDCIRLTEDYRLLPHIYREKENKFEVKKMGLHAVETAVKDLEKFVPKNSLYLQNSQDNPNHQCYENSQFFSNLYEVPITENLQTSLETEKDVRFQIDHDITCSHPEYEVDNQEIGGNDIIIKRSRISEEGHSNPTTPNRGGSTVDIATCKHMFEKKEKGKESLHSCSPLDKFVAEYHEMRVIRENEVKVMEKRLDFEEKKELKKEEWKTKMYYMHLTTLFAKHHLLPEDEDMKRHLLSKLYGK